MSEVFTSLGLPSRPVILAPLAGVSDHPFRRICTQAGADLTYVEMISATALLYESRKTLEMLYRHPSEGILGVQITARSPEEMGEAVARLDTMPFDTIDINMGCPVKKVVKTGCGSAILRDPERVYRTTLAACQASSKPVSVKIRLGWDHNELTYKEVGQAAQEAGAKWLTLHGRTRNDTYGEPVDLARIGELKQLLRIPVVGNGNIFSRQDAQAMQAGAGVDGYMVSRGALGNPWVFAEIKGEGDELSLDAWLEGVETHLRWQEEAYGGSGIGAVCMRKHILWYVKGWPSARKIRDKISACSDLATVKGLLAEYGRQLREEGCTLRAKNLRDGEATSNRFLWDPKFDMDRQWDRGLGDEGLREAGTE